MFIILYLKVSTIKNLTNILFKIVIIYFKVLNKIIFNKNKLFILKFWMSGVKDP